MNKGELGRMLEMVDEKYIAQMFDTTVRVQPAKRRIALRHAVSAAVICLAVGLSLKGGSDTSPEEGEGVTGDSESISTDIIPGESAEVLTGETSYKGLFEYPLDMGGFIMGSQSGTGICRYYYSPGNFVSIDIPIKSGDEVMQTATLYTDSSGDKLSADILVSASGEKGIYAQLDIAVTEAQGWEYGSPSERYGEQVYSFYCEKMDGLRLWAYFERNGRQYSVSSNNFDRETAAAVLDSLLTGGVNFDGLTPKNAIEMICDVPVDRAAALPGFDWIYTGSLGSAYLRDDTGLYHIQYDGKGNITGSLFTVAYVINGEEFAVHYKTESMADIPAHTMPPDISDITPEQLDELCSSNERTVTAGENVITVTGSCPRETLEILIENIKSK